LKVILVRPNYDYVTHTMNSWGANASFSIDTERDLDGFVATKDNLRRSVEECPNARLLAFYGHGLADSLVVKDSQGIESALIHMIGPGVLPKELGGRHLYAVACHSGSQLGPALAKVGCSFVGYKKAFNIAPGFETEFEDVVNRSLVTWATETITSREIRAQLRHDWLGLSDSLTELPGAASNQWVAALSAFWNGHRVCAY
jgi:hypothetical protein